MLVTSHHPKILCEISRACMPDITTGGPPFSQSNTWFKLQIERMMKDRGTPPRSNISPFGHQIRVLEPTTSHVPKRGPNVVTGPRHPAPNLTSLIGSVVCADADGPKSRSAAIADMRNKTAPPGESP